MYAFDSMTNWYISSIQAVEDTFCKMQPGYITGWLHIDSLVQEKRNSSALAMGLSLSWTNPSIYVT